jgi:3-phenylpropionate/trans-cinnamate dioxygenase ferredoxin reductase component
MTGTVLIAGAGLAGARCAEMLRALGWRGRIVLAGEEPHPPYERPALSKEFLAGTRPDVSLRPDAFWSAEGIELALGRRVSGVDARRRTARVGKHELHWDALVIATGARAKRLDGPRGAHHLRTLDDARALGGALRRAARVVVVGAGFVGTEVASTATAVGLEVTVVEPLETPLARVLGREVGSLLARRYRAHGVDLRCAAGLRTYRGDERLRGVELTDGARIRADVAVVGIGTEPAGIGPRRAIETDDCGRTTVPGVYACGDVAAWWRPSLGRHIRVEHWTSAAAQARAVAAAICGEPASYDEPPYFWSDQFGLRLQYVGHAERWHAIAIEGDDGSFTARYVDRDGALLAALAVNRTHEVGTLRRELAA